jgi:chromosome segregation ATPase
MRTDLNLDNLKEIHEKLTNTIQFLSEEASKARDAGKIDSTQLQKAQIEWGKLETKELELRGLTDRLKIEIILNKDVNSSYSQILNATDHLNKAAEKIDDFSNVLSEIAKVVDVVTSTIKAIKSVSLTGF